MKKTVLFILASLLMACIGAGCSEEEEFGYHIRGDKLVSTHGGYTIKYSPRDINDYPDFLNVKVVDALDDFISWFECYIWTGMLEGKRYYCRHSTISSRLLGYMYTETGEYAEQTGFEDTWTDVEVIYIHPKYIEYCEKEKSPLSIMVP